MTRRIGSRSTALIIAFATAVSLVAASQTMASCQDREMVTPGWHERSVLSQTQNRDYQLLVPENYTATEPLPLIIDLQASGITPEEEVQITGMDSAANRHRFLLAAPKATYPYPRGGYTWNIPRDPNAPSDVAFIGKLIRNIEKEFCLNDDKVFAIGYSGGARLASEIACRRPKLIDGIAAVGGLRHPKTGCATDSAAVPIIAFHSTEDPINPYEATNSSPPYWHYGIDTALERWVSTNNCKTNSVTPYLKNATSGLVNKNLWTDCRSGAKVLLYRLNHAGHIWPGSTFAFPDYVGRPEPDLPASKLILEFFRLVKD